MTPAPTAIDRDIHCIQCGYNLRGLDEDSRCPKCGRCVVDSFLFPEHLHNSGSRWLRAIWLGALLYLLGGLLWEVAIVGFLVRGYQSFNEIGRMLELAVIGPRPWLLIFIVAMPADLTASPVLALVGPAILLVASQLAGMFLLGSAEPGPLPCGGKRRRRLRLVAGLMAIALLVGLPLIGGSLAVALALFVAVGDLVLVHNVHRVAADLMARCGQYRLANRLRACGGLQVCFLVVLVFAVVLIAISPAGPIDDGFCAVSVMLLLLVPSVMSRAAFWETQRHLRAAGRARRNS